MTDHDIFMCGFAAVLITISVIGKKLDNKESPEDRQFSLRKVVQRDLDEINNERTRQEITRSIEASHAQHNRPPEEPKF